MIHTNLLTVLYNDDTNDNILSNAINSINYNYYIKPVYLYFFLPLLNFVSLIWPNLR